MADGEIFNTITNGKNTMMSYGGNVPVADRWAIISYVRALQRSQNAVAADVPPEELAKLEKTEAKPPEPKPATSPEAPKRNERAFSNRPRPPEGEYSKTPFGFTVYPCCWRAALLSGSCSV